MVNPIPENEPVRGAGAGNTQGTPANAADNAAQQNAQNLRDSISGANRRTPEPQDVRLTEQEAQAWIQEYKTTHNCTEEEARNAFSREFEKDRPILRKIANVLGRITMAKAAYDFARRVSNFKKTGQFTPAPVAPAKIYRQKTDAS